MSTALRRRFTAGNHAVIKFPVAGFTLLESVIIVGVIGILAAIAVPAWIGFWNTQQLNVARDEVYQAMRQAQGNARHNRVIWQASFRQQDGTVQWTVHPASVNPTSWKTLSASIELDDETTLRLSKGARQIQFDEDGNVNGQLGRITLSGKASSKTKRCVIVSTLVGSMRIGEDRARKQDGKSCY